jgi:NitT/TauT family transport system substrate-binding protein
VGAVVVGGAGRALAGALALAALAVTPAAGAGPSPPGAALHTLRLGLSVPHISYLPAYVAADHTFREAGLRVELVSFRGSSELAQGVASGSVDVGSASLSTVVSLVNAGHGVRVFYGAGSRIDLEWVAGPGVRAFADLRGRRVGISTHGALTDLLTRYALQKHGLDPERDVQILQVGGSPLAFQALRGGRVDVALLAAPFKWHAEAAGLARIASVAGEVTGEWITSTYFTRQAFLAQHAEVLQAFLRAHVAAIRLARTDRAATIATIEKWLKFTPGDAARAYDDAVPGLDERGALTASGLRAFWELR